MDTALTLLAVAAMVAVVFVLVRGLWNMMKGGDGVTSNKLMQARVVLQFVAVVLVLLVVWLTRR